MEQALTLEAGLAALLEQAEPSRQPQRVALAEAAGRICFEEQQARFDQPPFDRSPLDGYAVRAEDISTAQADRPVHLRITETLYAGNVSTQPLAPGAAVRLMTGSPLPTGCDCVVRQEDCTPENGRVAIYRNPGAGQNLVRRGEDLRAGALILARGQCIESAHIAMLAAQGVQELAVYPRCKVGLLATGNELAAAGAPLRAAKIYDSNTPLLAARLASLGAAAVTRPPAADDLSSLEQAVNGLLAETALVITTGGASVGERDLLPELGRLLGAELLFRRLQYKPGGGVLAWARAGKLVLCLSGNPFAALVSFELLAAPLLRKLQGAAAYQPRRFTGSLQADFAKASPQRRFVRALLQNGQVFLPTGNHSAGALATLPGCNCLIDIPAGTPGLRAGETVTVIAFQGGNVR